MPKAIKFGIIGCSEIANNSTIPAILESKNAQIGMIGSRTVAKAKNLQRNINVKNLAHMKKY